MAETIIETVPTTKTASKTPKTGKALKAAVKTAVKEQKKAAKVRTVGSLKGKDKENYEALTTKEEREWFLSHDCSLRGIVRKNGYKVPEEKQQLGATELKEKTGSPLRKPQARILFYLSKAKGPLTRKQLSELTGIDLAWVGDWMGYQDKAKRDEQEKKWGRTSLITLKAANWVEVEIENRTVSCAEITATGRKLLEQWDKVQKEGDKPTIAEAEKARLKGK